MEITTRRLRLIAASTDMVEAELESAVKLAQLLDCEVPDSWPPPLNDEESARWFLAFAREHPDAIGWGMWYFAAGCELVGNGGFKGRPFEGAAEIGYSIVPRFHRCGFASEAVRALVSWAFEHHDVDRVIAHTLPDGEASMGVLRKNGFACVLEGEGGGIIRFELTRERWTDCRGAAHDHFGVVAAAGFGAGRLRCGTGKLTTLLCPSFPTARTPKM